MSRSQPEPAHLFDDRLETVLRTRAQSAAGERTQFRQLLDLLGTAQASETGSETIASAYARLDALRRRIPAEDQSRILRESGLRLRSPQLVAYLAQAEPKPAASAMATARLTDGQWQDLIPTLPVIARGFLRHRRDLPAGAVAMLARLGVGDLALPDPGLRSPAVPLPQTAIAAPVEPVDGAPPVPGMETRDMMEPPAPPPLPVLSPAPPPQTPPQPAGPVREPERIGALLERIEQFREGRRAPVLAPRLPLGDVVASDGPPRITQFDVVTDAAGQATGASDPVAPWITGMLLTAPQPGPLVQFTNNVGEALRRHQPVRAARLHLAATSPISGDWQLDATPAFDPANGSFAGYHCRLRRPAIEPAPAEPADSQADRMRQVLHDLRTPVGAIQGFAEIIQQQVFGPVPHAYRAHAASIAVDAARLLAGFDEIDRLSRLEGRALKLAEGESDFRAAVSDTLGRLEAALRPREAAFALTASGGPFTVALDRSEALALCWRVLATLASALGPGETLPLELHGSGSELRFSCQLPAPLRAPALAQSETPAPRGAISAGMFGPGFAFRLARAEIEAAGGSMTFDTTDDRDGKLSFTLPVLTGTAAPHSRDAAPTRG